MYQRLLHRKYRKRRFFWLFLVLSIILALLAILGIYKSDFLSEDSSFDTIITKTALRYNLDPNFLKAVISHESNFDRYALGGKGEVGLMQIRPETAVIDWSENKKLSPPVKGLLFHPAVNIDIGAWYLSRALNRWSDYRKAKELALCEYNAGRSNAKRWAPNEYDGEIIQGITYPSTQNYVRSIMSKYKNYIGKKNKKLELVY